ncbi:MAG: hypothetical protein AAFR73_10865 [Pseudomonadota bacterium]
MGTTITDWSTVAAEYYTGAGGGEVFWLLVSIIMCIVPLVIGSKHELDAYKKLKK